MGPELPKPAAWQGLPNVSTSLHAQAPWAHLDARGRTSQEPRGQLEAKAGGTNPGGLGCHSTLDPRQNFSEQNSVHSVPPSILWDAGNSPQRAVKSRAGGFIPISTPPLLLSGMSSALWGQEISGVGGGSAQICWGLFLGPAELVGMEGEGTGVTTAAGTWDVCPSWGAQPTPRPASSVPDGN